MHQILKLLRFRCTLGQTIVLVAVFTFSAAYISQQRALNQLREELDRYHHVEDSTTEPTETPADIFTIQWNTVIDAPSLRVIRITVDSGFPHSIRCGLDGRTEKFASDRPNDRKRYESNIAVTIIHVDGSDSQVIVNDEIGDFQCSLHGPCEVDNPFGCMLIPEGPYKTFGGSCETGAPSSEVVEKVFLWNGVRSLAVDAVFDSGRTTKSDDDKNDNTQ